MACFNLRSELHHSVGHYLGSRQKKLRDKILDQISDWEDDARSDLSSERLPQDTIDYIVQRIRNDANSNLDWQSLDRTERYNTPFFEEHVIRLRKEYQELEVHVPARGRRVLSVRLFSDAEIDAAFTDDVKPIDLDDA